MTPLKQPGSDLPDNLPLLTQVADEDTLDDLPTLTEVIIEELTESQSDLHQKAPAPAAAIPVSCTLNEEEMQRLLQRLEAHLDNILTRKLTLHLEQLQRQAVEQAVSEVKAELPELLRHALNAHPEL